VGLIAYALVKGSKEEFHRMVVLMVLIASTIVFWALFEQAAGSMTLYADRVVDRNLGGTEIAAGQFGSLNAGFIMLLALPFAGLWVWLDKHKLNPGIEIKFALGIIQAGLGFGALVLGAQFPDEAGKISLWWLVLAYLLHTTGELCLSPVGLSAVTKLAIHKVVGLSMGTWFLATALSETVAMRLAKMAAIETVGGEVTDVAKAAASYAELFEFLMWTGIITGVFMLLISPLLKKGMHGVR
jgi:POT family proton-dependent oligopeptide transporter